MRKLLPLAVATLLVCALPAVALSGGVADDRFQRSITATAGDANDLDWLTLSDGPVASGTGHVGIDLSASLDDDANRLESRYDEYRIDARLDRTTADAERRAILREESERLSTAVTELRERERQAYVDYYEGDIGERELLIELATVHANAAVLEGSVSTLDDRTGSVSGLSLDAAIESMQADLATMQGPVRERAADMLRGETEPTRIYVETDDSGVVLATVEDGYFYREAYRADYRDPGSAGTELHNLSDTIDRVTERYSQRSGDISWNLDEGVGAGTHRATGTHSKGSLTAYIDTGTGEVYREYRTLRLDRVDTATVANRSKGGVELTVDGTVPGGPAKVSVTDASTAAPLSGEVAVNGRTLGETNDQGEIWVIMPRESMTVTASVGSTTVQTTGYENGSGEGTVRTSPNETDGL